MNSPIIIMSPGRSGSTFLCNLLMMDSRISVIQEVWSYRTNRSELLSNNDVNGSQLWDMINQNMEPELYELLSKHLIPTADMIHGRKESILLRSTLPRIFNDPFLALNNIHNYCLSLPTMSKKEAITEVFRYIVKLSGRSITIEKTGGSLRYFDELTNLFNESKIIFLARDGRNVALSKSLHPGLIYNHIKRDHSGDPLGAAKKASKSKYTDDWLFQIQLSMAQKWSEMVTYGLERLKTQPEQNYLIVKYEDLISEANTVLLRIIDFIEISQNLSTIDFRNLQSLIKISDTDYRRLPTHKLSQLTECALRGLLSLDYEVS